MSYLIQLGAVLFSSLWTICLTEVRVVLTAPLNPVIEDAVCALHCQLWNLDQKSHKVDIYRNYDTSNRRLSSGDRLENAEDDNLFLAIRQLDGSTVYFLSMTGISRQQKGNYTCKVIRTFPDTKEILADSISLDVLYSPGDSDPQCSSDFDTHLTVTEGTQTSINCSSEMANPIVELHWSIAGKDVPLKSTTNPVGGRVYSILTFTPSRRYNGAIFLCKIVNHYGDDKTRSCHVGPFKVIPQFGGEFDDDDSDYELMTLPSVREHFTEKPHEKETNLDSNPGQAIVPDECISECSLLSRPVIYWIIGTVFTSIIALTFLVLSSFLFYKLCHISSNSTNLDYALPRKPAEELYVEVDCKRDDGRMYMALQKAEHLMLRNELK